MKEYNVTQSPFVAKNADEIDAFCLYARMTVERFILVCRRINLMPSYDVFRLWMEATPR